ncbi:MAG: hypothetical protein AB7G35_15070 [Hyphomicrobiaceae bacterium]
MTDWQPTTPYPIEMPETLYVEVKTDAGHYVGEMCVEVTLGIDIWGELQCVVAEEATIERDDKCPVARMIWLAAVAKFRTRTVQDELADLMVWRRQGAREAAADHAYDLMAGK